MVCCQHWLLAGHCSQVPSSLSFHRSNVSKNTKITFLDDSQNTQKHINWLLNTLSGCFSENMKSLVFMKHNKTLSGCY
jgi:hypothetical protein